jgi:hypothetical protein
MKRRLIATIGLSLGLVGVHGGAFAQQTQAPVITGNVNGSCMRAPPAGNHGANAGDWTITCGDLNPGAGMTVIGPPSVESILVPVDVAPAPAPASDSEPAPGDEPVPVAEPAAETTVDAVATDTAVASETDLDADNYPDALEVEVGLDPRNPDTDGDGVADGDEGNLYGTDPFSSDTDGDGLSDGEELFGLGTDPLVWDDLSTDSTEQTVSQETIVDPEQALEQQSKVVTLSQKSSETLTATNGDAAALGNGNASSAPGTVTRAGVSGVSLLGPDGTYRVTEISPPIVNVSGDTSVVEIVPAPAPEPVAETTVDETSAPVAADIDGDGVADSDEVNLYGTDPNTWDTDGDGLSDGEELFVAGTDPLVWDTNGDGVSDGGIETMTDVDPLVADDAAPVVSDDAASSTTSVDSDQDRLADVDEAAVGTDPNNPDSDGDGYYDGDEVNLGTDPLDPASFPAG